MPRVRSGILVIIAAVAASLSLSLSATDAVDVDGGTVADTAVGGVRIFKGLPYAAPPVGARRWAPPQPVVAWSGVRNGTSFGAECPQTPYPTGSIYVRPIQKQSEDCLFLNVWTPAKAGDFATTGDPNVRGLPRWEPYDLENEPYLEFAGAIRQRRHLFKDRLDFQERFQNRAQQTQPPPAPPARPAPPAQTDPVVGNWRGTLKNAQGVDSPIIITFAKKGDGYAGSTNGLNATSEIPLKKLMVDGTSVALEASAESRLGDLVLTCELTADGNAMRGAGVLAVGAQRFDVTLALQRRPRAEVIQPHVEQRADYFVGRWTFEYVGAEYPPISTGTRTGTAAFTSDGGNFVTGRIDNDAGSRKYQDTVKIGLDPDTNMLVFVERRSDGFELASLGNWRSPIAITFLTTPVSAGGKTYQLRRVLSVTSNNAFEVTEELSVDGGSFKRLGKAHYTKTP